MEAAMMKSFQPARPPRVQDVRISSPFWKPILTAVREVMIPYQWEALNDRVTDAAPSHCLMNFRIAAGQAEGEFYGFVFQDSDLSKWLEAVGYSLAAHPDPALERQADEAIDLVVASQQPDSYINTYFTINEPGQRWTNLLECHELYCAGHLIEAAVAYAQGTGKRKLLLAACRLADHIASVFGPGESQLRGYPGHQEIELALMKLFEATGENRYFELARFFINERGRQPFYFDQEWERRGRTSHWRPGVTEAPGLSYSDADFREYNQYHQPVREQEAATGHAVRAVYMYAGMADVAAAAGDEELLTACRSLWRNIAERQLYITGGIGATHQGEAFTFDFDLPNDTVYAETCASIGLIFFSHRLLLLERDGRYADVIEQALYNTVIGSMDQAGQRFFYVNPLEVWPAASARNPDRHHVRPERQPWFGCACCPPNLARLLSSLGRYIYSAENGEIAVHLYIGGEAELSVGGRPVRLVQRTEYPWSGAIELTVSLGASAEFGLALRIPGWCRDYALQVNGKAVAANVDHGYASLRRVWSDGDRVALDLAMPVERVYARPQVRADAGRVALLRGPLVYCIEEADNGANLAALSLADGAPLQASRDPALLGGIVVVTGEAVREHDEDWGDALYRFAAPEARQTSFRAVPYFLWGNRGAGEMQVWLRSRCRPAL